MPHTARYTTNGAQVAFTGVTTGEEILASKLAALDHAYADGFEYAIFDFSRVERLEVPTAAVRRLAEEDREYARTHAPFAIAVVAPQTVTFGLARMWQAYVDGSGIPSIVVRGRDEALGWLASRGVAVGAA